MNYMKQVAEMLGVEPGEEFKIAEVPKHHVYKLQAKAKQNPSKVQAKAKQNPSKA